MSQSVIALSIAYVVLGVLLLGLNIAARWPIWVKVMMIVLVTGFYFITYNSLNGMLGWPTTGSLPDRFLLLASSVKEPGKKKGGGGGEIYLWVTSLVDNKPSGEPRAYQLRYSTELHAQLEQANKRIRDGVLQLGKNEILVESGAPRDLARFSAHRKKVRLYDLPDPELPEK